MSEEKCPPTEVTVNIEGLKEKDKDKKIQPLTDRIEGKGLSGIFYRSMDRGNSIPDMTDLDKAAHWLMALKEVGIDCDDLFDTYLTIRQQKNEVKNKMDILEPILTDYKEKLKRFHITQDNADLPNLDMSEIVKHRNEVEKDTMKLNLKVLDRFNKGLGKIYDKVPERLTKMIVEGMV